MARWDDKGAGWREAMLCSRSWIWPTLVADYDVVDLLTSWPTDACACSADAWA
jgi:hypothetical protein